MFYRWLLKPWGRLLVLLVTVIFFNATVVSQSMAGFAPSTLPGASSTDRVQDQNKIRQFLEHKIVQQRLTDLGFTRAEIESRLGRLSDGEIHGLASRIGDVRTGGDAVVTVLVIIILVIVLLRLMGHKLELKKVQGSELVD